MKHLLIISLLLVATNVAAQTEPYKYRKLVYNAYFNSASDAHYYDKTTIEYNLEGPKGIKISNNTGTFRFLRISGAERKNNIDGLEDLEFIVTELSTGKKFYD